MKKLHCLTGICLALLFAGTVSAQPDNYYRFNGNYDHGTGHKVVKSINTAEPGYLITGDAHIPSPNNAPVIFLSAFNPAGVPLWTRMFPVGTGGASTTAVGNSLAAAPGAAPAGYGILAYTDFSAPAQSILIRTNLAGTTALVTSLGNLQATSLIYDAAINQYVILGQAPTNNGDFQLISVDANTGAVTGAKTYDSGPGFVDTPSRLTKDPATGGYVAVGTSLSSADENVFVVRTGPAPGFAPICSSTYGIAGVRERGVDVVSGISAAGAPNDVVLAYRYGGAAGTIFPFTIELSPTGCPGVLSSKLYNPAKPDNLPTAIAFDPVLKRFLFTGVQRDATTNGFTVLLNAALNPLNYARYGQPAQPGNEDLRDVIYDPAGVAGPMFVFAGEHERINPWPGNPTPPNEFFNWMLMTNNAGIGACPDVQPVTVTSLTLVTGPAFPGSFFSPSPVSISIFETSSLFLDECANPFRLADPDAATGDVSQVHLYPNPASAVVNLEYTIAGTATAQFEMINMLGEVVRTESISPGSGTLQLDVNPLEAGMYFYRVTVNGNVLAKDKIVIRK